MVTVIKQPRWTFGTYEEVYGFAARLPVAPLLDTITAFYSSRRIRSLKRDAAELHFSRGSVLGSMFIPSERYHKHDASVRVTRQDDMSSVVCRFVCWEPFPNYHVPPRALQREVEELEYVVQEHERAV